MADTRSYENRYRRYLEDDIDTYLKPEPSGDTKIIQAGLATVGLIGGGLLAYKSGLMKNIANATLKKLGTYRRGQIIGRNNAIRRWSEEEGLGKIEEAFSDLAQGRFASARTNMDDFLKAIKTFNDHQNDAMVEHTKRVHEATKSQLIDNNFDAARLYTNTKAAFKSIREQQVGREGSQEVRRLTDEVIMSSMQVTQKEQEAQRARTGMQFATIQDLIDAKEVSIEDDFVKYGMNAFSRAGKDPNEYLKTKADDWILVDEHKKLYDFRDFRQSFNGLVNSLSTDFTIPLIKINPLRMFYLDYMFNTAQKPLFHVAKSEWRNPIVTGHNGATGDTLLFAGGKVYNLNRFDAQGKAETMAENVFLVDAKKGPVARLLRNIAGISISKFNTPEANAPFWKRSVYNIKDFLDVGNQDEPMGQFDVFDMTSWGTWMAQKITKPLQNKYQIRQDYLSDTFGHDADFIYMQGMKTLEQSGSWKEYMGQFTASRYKKDDKGNVVSGLKDITLATLFPYGLFERLNATLNQVGLGLSNKSLGSAADIFGNLLLKRVAPVWAGVELWDYLNYESENILGEQMSDRLAKMYVGTSMELARMRDALGVTEWAKETAPLFVGGEQLAEFPIFGRFFDVNDSEEETREYWMNGEDPVRRGRWWPLGNTPYTGAKIDYFEPNWYRRVLSDYEFTDSLYGSREEYFENSWMPTLRHPLAPIRHFLTDPYHYEQKHYDDRPYPVTGGIAELEAFPLVGPLLNSTIGQLLKPARTMHTEDFYQMNVVPAAEVMQAMSMDFSSGPPVGLVSGGFGGSPVPYIPEEVQASLTPALAVYTTSSGDVQVLGTEDQQNVYDVRSIMTEKSPMSTGRFKIERLPQPSGIGEEAGPAMTPVQWQQTVGNLHYNLSEMAGFYGFLATSMTGELFKESPVLQSSDEMTSYTRAFWDMDIGGYGGDANEIWRRFVPKDRKLNEVNAIPNTMPDYLPGSKYFVNFQQGDPYVKIKKGEMRLPGEGYEKLYNIDSEKMMKMEMGASFIGYDENKIRDHILKRDVVKDEFLNRILDFGTKWHKGWEKEMAEKNVAISMEQYVKDDESGIGGFYDLYGDHEKVLDWLIDNAVEFHYYNPTYNEDPMGVAQADASLGGFYYEPEKIDLTNPESIESFKQFALSQGDRALIDPKTRSERAWNEDMMHFENVQQVNFYGSQMKTPINYLIHVNRENPEAGIKVFAFGQSPEMLEYTKQKVEGIRAGIRQEIDQGTLHRGDLYDPIDRYRILADVAPYSEEFRIMDKQIPMMNLKDEEMEEVRQIRDQVQARKQNLRLYPYRFKMANLEEMNVVVDQIIDNNTFTVKGWDNPVRLAGLRISEAEGDPTAAKAQDAMKMIKSGRSIRIAVDADEQNRIKDDTYHTVQAVVYDGKGRNLNRYLLEQGLAKEKDNDYSPTAIHARFSPTEIAFGAQWEEFAHMDTMLHTKFLQVRSPLESYERREVYGKDWQEWTDPVDDYLIPAVQNASQHHPLWAIAGGAFFGAAFGSLKASDLQGEAGVKVMGRYGKIVGGILGATTMAATVLYTNLQESMNGGHAWVPERRQQERETEEYFDVLKYIKSKALFERYADLAMEREGFDVRNYVAQKETDGEWRQKRIDELEEIKRRLYVAKPGEWRGILDMLAEKMGIEATDRQEALKKINAELTRLKNFRQIENITPLAAKAIQYQQASKQTMYGYESGDPVSNVLAALPKKDRDYLVPFIEAPEEERSRILDIVPNYMKRVLQSAWGMPVDEKPSLQEYFETHPLPSKNWDGWNEKIALSDIKVKFVDAVGLDPSEFDIWPTDQQRAKALDVPIPDVFDGKEVAYQFSRKIHDILAEAGLDDTQVEIVESDREGIHLDMRLAQNRRRDFQRVMNTEGQNVI